MFWTDLPQAPGFPEAVQFNVRQLLLEGNEGSAVLLHEMSEAGLFRPPVSDYVGILSLAFEKRDRGFILCMLSHVIQHYNLTNIHSGMLFDIAERAIDSEDSAPLQDCTEALLRILLTLGSGSHIRLPQVLVCCRHSHLFCKLLPPMTADQFRWLDYWFLRTIIDKDRRCFKNSVASAMVLSRLGLPKQELHSLLRRFGLNRVNAEEACEMADMYAKNPNVD